MKHLVFLLLMLGSVGAWAQDPFITYWKTDNPGTSNHNQISIPVVGNGYDFVVLWGDGTFRAWKDGDPVSWLTHTYPTPGTYKVEIIGHFPNMQFPDRPLPGASKDPEKLIRVTQWGGGEWNNVSNAFLGAKNMQITATDAPDLSGVTSMYGMFNGAISMNSNLNHWNVSNVTDMSWTFLGSSSASSLFNGDITGWNVSNVTNMRGMFGHATSFNRAIGGWNVGNVTNMSAMFFRAHAFNAHISSWNVGNVTDMSEMFRSATSFNQNLGGWNTGKVTNMDSMFENIGNSFNPNVSNWNVANVTSMERMFYKNWGISAFNRNLGNWNIGKVENMKEMLDFTAISVANYDATLLGWAGQSPNLQDGVEVGVQGLEYCTGQAARQFLINQHGWTFVGDQRADDCPAPFVTRWKTDNPGPSANNQITIPIYPGEYYDFTVTWGDGNSTNWTSGNDPALLTHTYGQPGTYNVHITGTFPRIYFNFEGDRQKILSVMDWGDIEWSSMERAFAWAVNLDVFWAAGAPDLSNVISTSSMFEGASSLNADLDHWNVSNVELMVGMFKDAYAFNGNIASWDVSSVINMTNMFRQAFAFNGDLSAWNTENVENMHGMFRGTDLFNGDISTWNVGKVSVMREMFLNAVVFNRNLGNWNIQQVIDMGDMLAGAGLSVQNYDATLTGWASGSSVQSMVPLGAIGLVYCAAAASRQQLIDTYLWEITGDSICNPVDLGTPIHLAPADLSENLPNPVTLVWQAVDQADGYHVQVARAPNTPDFPVFESTTAQTSIALPHLLAQELYIWRVRALTNSGQYGDWTDIWYFSVSDANEEPDDIIFRSSFEQ